MATLRFYVCFMLTFTLVTGQSAYYVLKAREAILTPALTKPPDDILWKHNGEKVITFDSAEERVFAPYHDRVLLAWDTAQLSITDVRYEDSGEYELDANVNGRLYRSQYLLKVLDKVSKPVITCEMSDDESSSNGSTAVRATLSCSSQSMTPEALKFKWNLEGKSHLGPALSIALGNDLDDITYSCTANNPLHAETSVFTAKDCYTEKSSQALDILVPIIIASLILLAFCLFPFIFRHQIKRACFMNGKNNDLEKQLQAAAADSAQNNEERAHLLETDLHRQETIPSQQRLPKQSGVDNATPGKVKELRKRFQPSEHPETDTAQTNGNVGPVTSQPVSPSSSVPKTSAGLMASGGKSALNSEELQNTDTDSNHTDPEEYQDAQGEAQSTHTDQVQQNTEPTSGGQLNSDQAESEADEHRENQKEAEPDEPTRTRVQQVKSGSKERIDANEETNTDMVEVDPQKDLSKKETMALKEKELEMSREHPAQSSSPPDQGLVAPEVTQRPDDEDLDTKEVASQKDPEESESAEEEPGLAKKAEQSADSAQNNEERAQLLETALHRQETIPSQQRLPKQPSVIESGVDYASPGQFKELHKVFQPSEHPETDTAQTNGNVGLVSSQPVSPSSSVPKTSAGLMASGGKSALNSEELQNTDTDPNHTDPEEYQDAQGEAQSTHTDQVQQNTEPTSGGQLNSDQAESEADEHRENQKEAEPDEPTRTRVQQDDTQSTNKGQDVMVEAKQEENDLSLTGTASKQPELLQSTAAPVLPVKSGSKERIDANEETNTDMVEVDPQKDLSKKETMALKEKELEMSREHPAQSSSPPDQGLVAPEVTQRPDDEDLDTKEVASQKDPEESESAEEEPGLAKKAEQSDALSPQAPVQSSSSQDQDSKPEDREKVEEAQTNGNDGSATSQHVFPSSCAGKTSASLIPPGGEPDLISEDYQNTDTDPNHSDPEEYQDAPEEAQSTHTDQVQPNMEPTLPAQSSSPPDQGLAAPEVTQTPDGGEVAPQKDPEESESAEEEPGLAKKAEKPDALLPQARAESSSSQDQDSKPEDKEKVDCAEDSNSDSIVNLQHEDQKVTSDHNGTESNDKSELSNKVNSPADNTSSADGSPLPESDQDQPLTSEPSGVKDKSDKEMDTDTVDPQIQDSPSKESEESKLTNSSVPGSEEQESTHPPDSSLSPPTDENEEPKDADAELKDEADKAQAVKLDADKL